MTRTQWRKKFQFGLHLEVYTNKDELLRKSHDYPMKVTASLWTLLGGLHKQRRISQEKTGISYEGKSFTFDFTRRHKQRTRPGKESAQSTGLFLKLQFISKNILRMLDIFSVVLYLSVVEKFLCFWDELGYALLDQEHSS